MGFDYIKYEITNYYTMCGNSPDVLRSVYFKNSMIAVLHCKTDITSSILIILSYSLSKNYYFIPLLIMPNDLVL